MSDIREIPGFPGYWCDANGEIYSARSDMMRMKKRVTTCGYESIHLSVGGGKYRYPLVHRLILETFAGPPRGRHGNHKNGVRTDNRLDNLEWVTRSENERHARDVLGKLIHGAHHPCSKLTDEKVAEIRSRRALGWTYQSIADHYGIALSHAARVANGKVWRHVT